MFSIDIACRPEEKDLLIADLWEAGPAGIVELDSGLRAFFEDDAMQAVFVARFHAESWRPEEQQDWLAMSRANWEPMEIGERFFLVPDWRDDPAPAGRYRIEVNPGMAFGTGRHETTQLCLEMLERYVRPGMRVLDVGTGAGILAQAAALLGAAPVWGCDVDEDAVLIARQCAGHNLFAGSVNAVRSRAADLIVANISPEGIISLGGEIMRCLRENGSVIVSGFERHETKAVENELDRHGGVLHESAYKGSWAVLVVGGKLVGGV